MIDKDSIIAMTDNIPAVRDKNKAISELEVNIIAIIIQVRAVIDKQNAINAE